MESWHRKFVHLPSCYFSEKANFKIILFYCSSTPTSSRIAHSKITRYTENILFQLQRWQKKEKNKMKRCFKNKSSYASLEKNLAENNM